MLGNLKVEDALKFPFSNTKIFFVWVLIFGMVSLINNVLKVIFAITNNSILIFAISLLFKIILFVLGIIFGGYIISTMKRVFDGEYHLPDILNSEHIINGIKSFATNILLTLQILIIVLILLIPVIVLVFLMFGTSKNPLVALLSLGVMSLLLIVIAIPFAIFFVFIYQTSTVRLAKTGKILRSANIISLTKIVFKKIVDLFVWFIITFLIAMIVGGFVSIVGLLETLLMSLITASTFGYPIPLTLITPFLSALSGTYIALVNAYALPKIFEDIKEEL